MNRMNRREMLKKSGALAATLPCLSSLFTGGKAQAATTAPKRVVIIYIGQGVMPPVYWPQWPAGVTPMSDGELKYLPLSSLSNSLSPHFGTYFNNFRSQMNIYQNLDLISKTRGGHTRCAALCSVDAFKDAPSIGATIDNIIAKAPSVYAGHQPNFRSLKIDGYSSYLNMNSWDRDLTTGSAVRMPTIVGDGMLFNAIFGSLAASPAEFNKLQLRKSQSIQNSIERYRTLLNSSALSFEDRQRAQFHIDLLIRVRQNKLNENFVTCKKPDLTLVGGPGGERPRDDAATLQSALNMNDIVTHSLLCDLTRVVYINLDSFFSWHWHSDPNDPNAQKTWLTHQDRFARIVSDLATKMDSVVDPANGKKLLDNSVIYVTNEMGEGGSAHSRQSIATFTIGGANGALRTGYYLDCKGQIQNRMNATIMQAMGLTSSDYNKYGDGNGYGEYSPVQWAGQHRAFQEEVKIYEPSANLRGTPFKFVYQG